jgi:hypothetical protein
MVLALVCSTLYQQIKIVLIYGMELHACINVEVSRPILGHTTTLRAYFLQNFPASATRSAYFDGVVE